MELEPLCQVCFSNPNLPQKSNSLIKCSKCQQAAHRYCYAPNSVSNEFVCDPCREGVKVSCKWCLNPGLLKQAGKHYGHPLCLLFNASAIVDHFSSLTFSEIQTNSRFGKLKCDYCKNTTSSVLRCCLQCKRQTHIYCALQHSKSEDGVGWKLALQPLNDFRNYLEPYENLIMRALRTRSSFLASQLGVKKSIRTVEVGVNLYCEQHSQTLVECVCREFNEAKLEWVYCDGCCRWQHADCLSDDPKDREILHEESKQPYLCLQCREWRAWLEHPREDLPEKLPKMHIYDYIRLHCLLQKNGKESPQNWVDFLLTAPLLPGKIYAELFFRKQLVKKLKHKIDLPLFKNSVQELDAKGDYEGLCHLLEKNKDRLQLIWLLTEGALFGEQSHPFQHPLDDMDPEFVDYMLDTLHRFELEYSLVKSQIFSNARKNMGPSLKKVKEQQQSQTHEKEGEMSSSNKSKKNPKRNKKVEKTQNKSDNRLNREDAMNKLAEELQTILARFKPSGFEDFESFFSELSIIMTQPGARSLMQELPRNLFTNSVLQFQNPRDSAAFMQYIAHINHLQHQWQKLKIEGGGVLTSRQFPQAEELNIMGSCLKEQVYRLAHDKMQCLLLTEIHHRQSLGNFPTLSAFQYCFGYQPQEWTVIPQDLLNIKDIKQLIKVKDLNLQKPPRLHLACSILQQLSTITFTKTISLKARSMLEELRELYPELAELLETFVLVYDTTLNLLAALGEEPQDANQCLFRRLSSLDLGRAGSDKAKKKAILSFLTTLKYTNLSYFSLLIQKIIKDQVLAFFSCYEQQQIRIETQSQLNVVKNWMERLDISLPCLQKIIKDDDCLCERFIFVQPRFQLPQAIDRIEVQVKRSLEECGTTCLVFRRKKMKLVLQWIKTYRLILQYLPFEHIVSSQKWAEFAPKSKPALPMISQLLAVMGKMYFPEGIFKTCLEDIVRKGKALKAQYEQLMAGCQWGFVYGKSQPAWERKISIGDLEQFIEEAQLIPLNLQVEILESQIVIQKFRECENMAGILLAEATQKTLGVDGLQRIQQILNHMGATPLKSDSTDRVIQLMDQLLGRSRREIEVQQLCLKVKDKQPLPYESVLQVLSWCEQGKITQKIDSALLREVSAPILESLQLFATEIQQFCAQDGFFSESQIAKMQHISTLTAKTSLFEFTLTEMTQQLSIYNFLLICSKQLQTGSQLTPKQISRILTKVECLHPCFMDKSMKALKIQLLQSLDEEKLS